MVYNLLPLLLPFCMVLSARVTISYFASLHFVRLSRNREALEDNYHDWLDPDLFLTHDIPKAQLYNRYTPGF